MSARVHHLKSRRALLGAVAATAVLAVGGFATSQAWGQSTGTTVATTAPATTVAPATATPATGDQLAVAKNRVDLKVDRRVAAIDKVIARVPTKADLSPAERTAVSADLTSLKSGLAALKAKVDADTTVAAIKADVKGARAAAKSAPSIEAAALYIRADVAGAYLDSVAARVATIQSKLTASGADATALNKVLSDIQAKATDARSHLSGFDAALLSPEPPSQAQVAAATTTLKAVAGDISAIRTDVKSLRQARAGAANKPAAG